MDVEETAQRIVDHVVRADHDPGALNWFLTEEAAEAADAVRRAGTLPDGQVLLTAVNAIGYYDWCRFLAGGSTDLAALGSAVLCFLDVHRASPDHVPPVLTPLLALLAGEPAGADADPGVAYEAGAGILLQYIRHRHPALLPASATLLRHAVAGFPEGSAEQGTCLSDLGLVLLHGFRDGGGPDLLDEALRHSRAAVAAAPGERAEQARRQGNLGLVLKHAAEVTSDPDTARESVETLRRTLSVSRPGDPYHPLHLALLGSALLTAATQGDEPDLVPEAVDALRRSVEAEGPGAAPPAAHLADLGMALIAQSVAPTSHPGTIGSPQDRTALYDEGIDTCRRAAGTAGNPVETALYLSNLAFFLNGRSVNTRNPAALDDAHGAARDALAVAPPGHPAHAHAQYVLSEVLRTRYVESGVLAELESAIGYARSALDATAPHDRQYQGRAVDLADLLRLHAQAVGAPEALAEPLGLLRRVAADTPPHSSTRARVLLALARVLEAAGRAPGGDAAAYAAEAERTFRECLALAGEDDGLAVGVRNSLGQALLHRANQAAVNGTTRDDLSSGAAARREGVALIQQALDLMAQDDPRRSEYLSDLGCHHLEYADATGDLDAYADAVRALRLAVAAAHPASGHDRALACSNLGAALTALGTLTADESLLAEGVRAHREAVAASGPRDHYRAHRLGNLGDALQRLGQYRSETVLVEEAVAVLREAIQATTPTAPAPTAPGPTAPGPTAPGPTGPHPTGPVLTAPHPYAPGSTAPGSTAPHPTASAPTAPSPSAPDLTVPGPTGPSPAAPGAADNFTRLGTALSSLSRLTGDGAHLDEAVHWQRQAVAATRAATDTVRAAAHTADARSAGTRPVSATRALVNLANILVERHRHSLDDSLRDEALDLYRAALAGAHEPADRHVVLTNYGNTLFRHAADTIDHALMDTAIGLLREATTVVPAHHTGRPGVLMNLGVALVRRSRLTGDRTWLAEALTVLRRAVDQSPPTHVTRSLQLANLAEALSIRYDVTGDRAAADEAASLLREAISLDRGERQGRDIARVALGVLLHRVSLPGWGREADPDLLGEAIRVLEEAVAAFDDRNPRRTAALINLAGTCLSTADVALYPADPALRPLLDRGLRVAREALGRVSEGHPHHAHLLWTLARIQVALARLDDPSDAGTRAELAEAIRFARQAAHSPVISVSRRLLAARTWGDAAAAVGEDAEALNGYAYGVELLPRLAPRGLARADQEGRLIIGTGLASDAAAFALRTGDPAAALTLLEQGRGVLLAQGLETRGDLSRLRTVDPDLAAEFERVRDALSGDALTGDALTGDALGGDPLGGGPAAGLTMIAADPGHPDRAPSGAGLGAGPEAGLLAESRHALARTWDDLLDRIRRLPGLEGFLTAPTAAELLGAASGGPVVVVNVSRHGSDALLVTPGEGIQVVLLPDLSAEDALNRAMEFVDSVDDAYGDQGARKAVAAMGTLSDTLEWLWNAVAEPVLDRLGPLAAPGDDEPTTRLWWCPTGWLSFLPLHAAGRPDPRPGETVMDRVVSSYTPTLRALVRARNAPSDAAMTWPAPLIVTLADTPGAPSLPGASQEARMLRKLFPAHVELAGAEATVEAVRHALPAHPWVHFSCHGVSDPNTPSESGLILHDGRLTARDAAQQRPGEAVLAVLSACSTSQGGFTLPDESVHLAASFQLAGYPHVIGTLWPVADKVATRLTEELYASLADDLARGRPIDPATALHRPVRALRRRLARAPHLWAAHIHTGP